MCVFLCLWTGRGLATSWSPVQGVLPNIRDLVNWSETESFMEVDQGPNVGCSAKGRKGIPVLNELSTTPWRRLGEWIYRSRFSDLGSSWRWVLVSRPGHFIPGEKAPGTHRIGGWVESIAGLEDVEKRKFLTLLALDIRPPGRPARSYPGSYCSSVWM
jgi:hypothetical protein